jgi:hypothetical protein
MTPSACVFAGVETTVELVLGLVLVAGLVLDVLHSQQEEQRSDMNLYFLLAVLLLTMFASRNQSRV